MPVRGVPGFNWTSDYMSFRHGPQEYGAIHFHDESVDDARWESQLSWAVPEGTRSGVYALRMRVNGEAIAETEDYIPFFVRPPAGGSGAEIAVIMSTFSYMLVRLSTHCYQLPFDALLGTRAVGYVPLLLVAT